MEKTQILPQRRKEAKERRGKPAILCVSLRLCIFAAFALVVTACGGGPPGTPTAIPATLIRADQPTPVFAKGAPVFNLTSEAEAVVMVADTPEPAEPESSEEAEETPTPYPLTSLLPPSALGLAVGGATIYSAPGGGVLQSVPGGVMLTVTGWSADRTYLAVYTDDAIAGWVPAEQLQLYGADDLTVVQQATAPVAVATLLAESMKPPASSAISAAMTAAAEQIPDK